jgi:molecular chaperone GrpE (heat shock protein)
LFVLPDPSKRKDIENMWSEIAKLFKKKEKAVLEEYQDTFTKELIAELGDMKKILRKQGILIEMSKKEILERLTEKEALVKNLQPFTDAADAFFHMELSFREIPGFSEKQMEAAGIVQQKLDELLSSAGLEIIQKTGVNFDPSLHEAVGRLSGADSLAVGKIIQPGYIFRGKVIRPAKVVIN